jgi:hypothetical protein
VSTPPTMLSLPDLLHDYLAGAGFWAGRAKFDFWYAVTRENYYWIHLRADGRRTLAVSLFIAEAGDVELDLYDLTRAPAHGLRSTIVNTPLINLQRRVPGLPLVAIRLQNGTKHHFTVARQPEALADQWLADALQRLHQSLSPAWHVQHAIWRATDEDALALWPEWAGPEPHGLHEVGLE